MTTVTDLQEHLTGEVCPSCESEVVAISGATEELRLQCDCGEAMALAPRTRLAPAA